MNCTATNTSSFRDYKGKKFLSYTREGDYAHPGEEDAIRLVFSYLPKKADQKILDAGSGLGGTANFIQKHHWGEVIGIDIDQDGIIFAQEKYPNCEFIYGDIHTVDSLFPNSPFDLICMFSTYYSFNQKNVLTAFHKVTKPIAKLAIFDYSDFTGGNNPLTRKEKNPCVPLQIDLITEYMELSGWMLIQHIDVTENFKNWYETLTKRIQKLLEDPDFKMREKALDAHKHYHRIYNSIANRETGGVILIADKMP